MPERKWGKVHVGAGRPLRVPTASNEGEGFQDRAPIIQGMRIAALLFVAGSRLG